MAIIEIKTIDKTEIVDEFKHLQLREKFSYVDEATGEELSSRYHRSVLAPDSDITGQPQEIQDIANLIWTQAIKDAWANHRATQG